MVRLRLVKVSTFVIFVLLIIYRVRIGIDAKLVAGSPYISPKSSLVAEQLWRILFFVVCFVIWFEFCLFKLWLIDILSGLFVFYLVDCFLFDFDFFVQFCMIWLLFLQFYLFYRFFAVCLFLRITNTSSLLTYWLLIGFLLEIYVFAKSCYNDFVFITYYEDFYQLAFSINILYNLYCFALIFTSF